MATFNDVFRSEEFEEDVLCFRNELTSLEGCPENVPGNFNCSNNLLKNLKGGPRIVKGDYNCNLNKLIQLEDAAEIVEGDFSCFSNEIESLIGLPKKIHCGVNVAKNKLTSLEGIETLKEDAVILHKVVPNDYVSVEYTILKCLGIGRGIEWKLLKQTLMDCNGRSLDQMKIETKKVTETEVITGIENYYFDVTECLAV